jgi:hypothetical protein
MTLVRIAVDQEAPGQDLLSRPGRMVLLRIAPQRGGTRVRRYVLWLGQVESQARHEAGDPPRRIAKQPECLRLASQPVTDQLCLLITLRSTRHSDDLFDLR